MAETGAVYTLNTSGVDITFNSGTDIYRILDITGLDQAPIRAPVDDKPQTDGGIVHNFYYGARHFTVEGVLLPGDATVSTRNTMEANLISSLGSCVRADATWSWTPTGQAARSLTVRCDVPVQFASYNGHRYLKAFIFGLVAATPTW